MPSSAAVQTAVPQAVLIQLQTVSRSSHASTRCSPTTNLPNHHCAITLKQLPHVPHRGLALSLERRLHQPHVPLLARLARHHRPNALVLTQQSCRFGSHCNNKECTRSHVSPAVARIQARTAAPVSSPPLQRCRWISVAQPTDFQTVSVRRSVYQGGLLLRPPNATKQVRRAGSDWAVRGRGVL